MPSDFEFEEGLRNLEKVDFKVDYLLKTKGERFSICYLSAETPWDDVKRCFFMNQGH